VKDKYQDIVTRLESLSCWGLLIGPAGLTIEFGSKHEYEGQSMGEFSVWIETRFRLAVDKKLVLSADFPLEGHLPALNAIMDNKTVTRAAIDPADNSLRLLVGETCLLSAFPGLADSEMPWTLFQTDLRPHGHLIAYHDRFEGPLA